MDSNGVTFNIHDKKNEDFKINSISLIPGSLLIGATTTPLPQPTFNLRDKKFWANLTCDRKGDSSIAKKFLKFCDDSGDGSHVYSMRRYSVNGGGPTPANLNFCFGCSILFSDGTTGAMYLGQGHFSDADGSHNPWWIGGPKLYWLDDKTARLDFSAAHQINIRTVWIGGNRIGQWSTDEFNWDTP